MVPKSRTLKSSRSSLERLMVSYDTIFLESTYSSMLLALKKYGIASEFSIVETKYEISNCIHAENREPRIKAWL